MYDFLWWLLHERGTLEHGLTVLAICLVSGVLGGLAGYKLRGYAEP